MHCSSRNSTREQQSRHDGFTLVEVLAIAPIILLTISIFIGAIISITGDVLVSRASNTLAYNVQDALNTIEQDIRRSGSFLAQNNVTITAPQGRNDNTAVFTNVSASDGPSLILNTIGTTTDPTASERELIYLIDEPNACASALITQNQVLTLNVVYFVKDNALWRRTLLPQNYQTVGCNGAIPWQRPTCTAPESGSYASGSFCAARDTRILSGVAPGDFTITYHTSAASTSAATAATNQSASVTSRQAALSSVTTAQVTLRSSQTVAGRDLSQTGTIRASRIGSLIEYAVP